MNTQPCWMIVRYWSYVRAVSLAPLLGSMRLPALRRATVPGSAPVRVPSAFPDTQCADGGLLHWCIRFCWRPHRYWTRREKSARELIHQCRRRFHRHLKELIPTGPRTCRYCRWNRVQTSRTKIVGLVVRVDHLVASDLGAGNKPIVTVECHVVPLVNLASGIGG